jgi:hypothetical protein
MDKTYGCDGCYVKNTCVTEGRDISGCPCLICLIKMVCDNPCEEFETFHDYMWESHADS